MTPRGSPPAGGDWPWLGAVLAQLPVGVSIIEASTGRVLVSNARANAIWRAAEPPERPAFETYVGFHPDGRRYGPEDWPAVRTLRYGETVREQEIDVRFGDGSPGTIAASSSPIHDEDGRLVAAVVTLRDVTQERRAEQSLRFLAEASDLLAQSLDERATLERLAFLAVPRLADWCTIDLVEADGVLRSAVVAHANPDKVRWARELQQRYPPDPEAQTGAAAVVRSGRSEIHADIDDALLVAAAQGDDKLLHILRELGLRSSITAPLRARGRTLGALTLIAAESGRRYDDEERVLAEDLAHRAALAIDNARLHAVEQSSRRRAELLEGVAASLASAATQSEIAEVVVRRGVEALGGSAAWVALLRGRTLELTAAVGFPPEAAEALRSIPLDAERPASVAVRRGTPLWFSSHAELEEAFPNLHGDYLRMGFEALAMVPLVGIGAPLGFLSVHFAGPHRFAGWERELVGALTAQCGQALERARLYEREREAADTLQRSLLPPRLPALAEGTAAARYRAAGEGNQVGGDFYDVWELPGDGFGVAIGDVCGKGSAAAALTALARHTVRTASMHEPTPSRVLEVLNDAVVRRTSGERFCTVAYAHVRRVDGRLCCTIACAGHPPPLLVRADGSVERIGRPGTLVGVFPQLDLADADYELEDGDLLLFFTDGVTERRRGGEVFGEGRLLRLAAQLAGFAADEAAAAIDDGVMGFGSEPHQDDIAVVAVRLGRQR